jgi:hypothetical protein
MQRLKDINTVPPEPVFFRFIHPETGHTSQAQTYQAWLQEAYQHRISNALPIPVDFPAQMEDQLCTTLPAGWCAGVDPNRPIIDMRFGLRQVKDWATAQLKLLVTGFVPQEEAERRAKICAGCPLNINAQGCVGCQDVAGLFAKVLGGRKTASDGYLRNCANCRCYLQAMVHFPQEILDRSHVSINQSAWPSFCWNKIGGSDYKK